MKFKYRIYRNNQPISEGTINGRGFEDAYYKIVGVRQNLKSTDEIELFSKRDNWTFKVSDWGFIDMFEYRSGKLTIKKGIIK